MAWDLVRSGTVGDVVPALAIATVTLYDAITGLRAVVDGQADALEAYINLIRPWARGPIGVQLDAALQAVSSLEAMLADPAAYLASLVTGSVQISASLDIANPLDLLQAQLNAALSISVELGLELAEVDAILAALSAIVAAIRAASLAVQAALDAYLAIAGAVSATGARVYRWTGDASGVPGLGLSGDALGVLVMTQTAPARAALATLAEVSDA